MKTLRILILMVLCFELSAQNVGIGTLSPKANLHLASNVQNINYLDVNFENNDMAPLQNAGNDGDWYVSSNDPYEGVFCLQGPGIWNEDSYQSLFIDQDIPQQRVVRISGYYKTIHNSMEMVVGTAIPIFLEPSGNWTFFNYEFIHLGGDGLMITFYYGGHTDIVGETVFLDNLEIEYVDGYALRIDDSEQREGALLTSDVLGNATWKVLDTEDFVKDSSSTNEMQTLSLNNSNNLLSISDANHVDLSLYRQNLNLSGNTLSLSNGGAVSLEDYENQNLTFNTDNELSISGGNTVQIDRIGYGLGNQIKVDSDGSVHWGQSALANGQHSSAWGLGTNASGNLSTAWGTYADANGTGSTAWGYSTDASGVNSTSWGVFGEALGENSTAWGESPRASADLSTAFGEHTNAEGKGSLAAGSYTVSNTYMETALGRYNYSPSGTNNSETQWMENDMLFSVGMGTSNSNRKNALSIVKDGKIGINKNVPNWILDIQANNANKAQFKSTSGDFDIIVDGTSGNNSIEWRESGGFRSSLGWDATNDRMFLYQGGGNVVYVKNSNLGVKESNPTFSLHLPNFSGSGTARAFAWTTYSDERVKRNHQSLELGLEALMKLRPLRYDHHQTKIVENKLEISEEHIRTFGLLAQEVYEVIPEVVTKPENENEELWGMDYEKLIPVMINAIQELKGEVEALKTQNATLIARLSED